VTRNFGGFPKEGLAFLRDLAANNDAAWFKPRRDTYEASVRGPMVALVADILSAAALAKLTLGGDPAKAVFRIHRDVRFAADKSPYKTHVGAAMTRSGDKKDPGLLYVHIQPGSCFMAAGFWQPSPGLLAAMRQGMLTETRAFLRIIHQLDEAGLPLGADEDALKRLPRGLEAAAGTPVESLVKYRNLVVRRPLTDAEVGAPALCDAVLAFYRTVQPLLAFGWRAAAAQSK
jgi:uncharacterized protein (TIGR02453 family)